jgi:hypothetical protein
MPPQIDPFTKKRIVRFIEEFRTRMGHMPSLTDFEASYIDHTVVDRAVRDGLLEQLYVTLTNGTVVKGYKVKVTD